jgi:ATP-dependent protease ClpP protease subunit
MSVFDALRNSASKTIMIVYAQASSMSSITLQGATLRLLMPNTEFLVHDGTFGAEGTPTQVTSALKYCERTRKVGVQIYAERCINGEFFKKKKMNLKEVTKFIQNKIMRNTDWYMDAREAIHYGFADGIVGEKGYSISFEKVPAKRKKN